MSSKYHQARKKNNDMKSDEELIKSFEKDFNDYPSCLLSFSSNNGNPSEKKEIIDKLKEFVQRNGKNVSTSQVRNLYTRARATKNEVDLQLLRPHIAYLLARQDKKTDEIRKFFLLPEDLISKGISRSEFLKVFEAIVAYHKVFGKKN